MSKLTKESFEEKWNWSDRGPSMEAVWEAIQSHTAECVAEAVDEVKRDHFRIGESVQYQIDGGRWRDANIWFSSVGVSIEKPNVRRPPKIRQMTDDELRLRLNEMVHVPMAFSRPTLEAMAKDLGIYLTVEE